MGARRKKPTFYGIGGLKIHVEGAQELIDAFKSLGEDAVFELEAPSVAAANIILAKAKSLVSVDEGDLKRGLKVYKPGKRNKKAYKITARVGFGKGAMHGVPLELGHRLMAHGEFAGYVKPHPFLRPAADESKEAVVAIMSNAMSNIIREAGQK